MHIRVTHEMVLETQHRTNIKYKNSSKCGQILIYFGMKFFLNMHIVINDVHYNEFRMKPKLKYNFTTDKQNTMPLK